MKRKKYYLIEHLDGTEVFVRKDKSGELHIATEDAMAEWYVFRHDNRSHFADFMKPGDSFYAMWTVKAKKVWYAKWSPPLHLTRYYTNNEEVGIKDLHRYAAKMVLPTPTVIAEAGQRISREKILSMPYTELMNIPGLPKDYGMTVKEMNKRKKDANFMKHADDAAYFRGQGRQIPVSVRHRIESPFKVTDEVIWLPDSDNMVEGRISHPHIYKKYEA